MNYTQIINVIPCAEISGVTHIMVEMVYHPSDHSGTLDHNKASGFYMYLWPLSIPAEDNIPEEYQSLLGYHVRGPNEAKPVALGIQPDYSYACSIRDSLLPEAIRELARQM